MCFSHKQGFGPAFLFIRFLTTVPSHMVFFYCLTLFYGEGGGEVKLFQNLEYKKAAVSFRLGSHD